MYRVAYATQPAVHADTGRESLDLWRTIGFWYRRRELREAEGIGRWSLSATARSENIDGGL
jgi:hypothetical protein